MTDAYDVDHNIGIGFHYEEELVKLGYRLWRASGYSHLPTPEELRRYDGTWLEDLHNLHQFVESQRPAQDVNDGQPTPQQWQFK